MDIHNVFLHGDLAKEFYIKPPPGFNSSNPHHVCLLKKSLLCLRQVLGVNFLNFPQLSLVMVSGAPMLITLSLPIHLMVFSYACLCMLMI